MQILYTLKFLGIPLLDNRRAPILHQIHYYRHTTSQLCIRSVRLLAVQMVEPYPGSTLHAFTLIRIAILLNLNVIKIFGYINLARIIRFGNINIQIIVVGSHWQKPSGSNVPIQDKNLLFKECD